MRSLRLGMTFDALSFEVDVPLSPLEQWWSSLVEGNAIGRAEDEGMPRGRSVFNPVMECRFCGAGAHLLKTVDCVRSCMRCRATL
jgi:hypothetical protein